MAAIQPLPDWMEYTTFVGADGSRTTATVQLPLTYTGASIPLGWPWVAADAPESERLRVSIIGGNGYQYRTPGDQAQAAPTQAEAQDSALADDITQDNGTAPIFEATMEQALDPAETDPSPATNFNSIVTLPNGDVITVESPAIAFTSTATDGNMVINTPWVSYAPDGSATLVDQPAVLTTLPNGQTTLIRPTSLTTLPDGSISSINSPSPSSSVNSLSSSSSASLSSIDPSIVAEQSNDDLSAGQIAGISLGSILFAGLILALFFIWFCVRRRQRLRGDDASWVGISNTPNATPQMAQVGRMPYSDEPLTATTGTSRTSEAEQFADPYEPGSRDYDDDEPPPTGGTGQNGSGSNRSGFSRNTDGTIDEDTLFYSLPGTRVPSRTHQAMRAPHLSDTREESESLLEQPEPYRDSQQSDDLMGLNSPEGNDQELFTLPRPAPDVPHVSPPSEPEEHDVVPDSRGIPLVSAASRAVGGYLGGLGIGNLILGNRKISGESQMDRKERESIDSDGKGSYTRPSTARLLGPKALRRLTAVGLDDSPTLGQEDDSSAESEAESEEAAFLPYETEKLGQARWSKTTLGRKVASEDSGHEAHSLVASLRSASHNSSKHVNRSQNSSYGSNNTRRSVSESGMLKGRRSNSTSRNGSTYHSARERSDSSGGHASRHTNRSDPSSEQAEIWQLPALPKR